eukprot:3911989-Pyramimonas_sp.AAC.1
MEAAAAANSPAACWLDRPSDATSAPRPDSRVLEREAQLGHAPRIEREAPGNEGTEARPMHVQGSCGQACKTEGEH